MCVCNVGVFVCGGGGVYAGKCVCVCVKLLHIQNTS